MVQKINLAQIMQRLRDRFSLVQVGQVAPPFLLSEVVVPVTILDDLVRTPYFAQRVRDLSGGGSVSIFTVPDGERWHLKRLHKESTAGTVYVECYDISNGSQLHRVIEAQTGEKTVDLDLVLDEKDNMSALGGGGGDTAIGFDYHYWVEKAFV